MSRTLAIFTVVTKNQHVRFIYWYLMNIVDPKKWAYIFSWKWKYLYVGLEQDVKYHYGYQMVFNLITFEMTP